MKNWILKMLSEGDGSPSTKRVLFVLVVVASLAFCTAELVMHGIAGTIELCKTLLVTTGSAYGIGRFAESRDDKKPQ